MTIEELAEKRKNLWEKYQDSKKDKEVVDLIAKEILKNKELLALVKETPTLLIETTFTLVDKNKKTVPFFLNDVQKDFLAKFLDIERDKKECDAKGEDSVYIKKPYIILKGRQQGFTTLITAIQLCFAITMKNFAGMTIADNDSNTLAIFNDKAKYNFNFLPDILKPHEKLSNRKELFFDKLNSSWRIQCASEEMGRSRTLNFVHNSEVATFRCNISSLQASIGQALTKMSVLIYESTANGYNEFKTLWDSGTCINLFYEWWRTKEYSLKNERLLDDITDPWLIQRVKWLKEEKHLNNYQIAWYVDQYNQYLEKNKIKQEYPCTPEEAFISTGDCIFETSAIQEVIESVRMSKPSRKGYFTYKRNFIEGYSKYTLDNVQFVETNNGYITLHEEPRFDKELDFLKQETGRRFLYPYTIGGDTSGSGKDYFTAKVVDNRTLKTVATLRKQTMDDDVYGEQLACLGKLYNNALIAIETNFSIVPNRILESLEYPKIYMRQREDTITKRIEQKLGFETNKKTKNLIISNLVTVMREDPFVECDIETLKEMLSFVQKDGNRREAQLGCHDDLVMALAIAHYALDSQGEFELTVSGEIKKDLYNEFYQEDKNEVGGYGEWFSPVRD